MSSKTNRRDFLKHTMTTAAVLTMDLNVKKVYAGSRKYSSKKVIIIGIDGMDPRLSERMMNAGQLPNFDRLKNQGGYKPLGTSIPPQSPVAWANFINGAGPGSHGIFDFIHRNPEKQAAPFFSASETIQGEGYWEIGDHKLQLDFCPFNHKSAQTVLKREGTPFWDYLDKEGISSTFYDLPSNYPPSDSKYGNHKCLSGMGTPDLLGTYGTYQHFAEDGPIRPKDEGGGRRSMIVFENETSKFNKLIGPMNTMLTTPKHTEIEFIVHRDKQARAAVIEIPDKKIILKEGRWSEWVRLEYEIKMPAFIPDKVISGICRFYLQEVSPNFRLYVTPVNIDPSEPARKITVPDKFIKDISKKLGLFYTTGFQEDHKALSNNIFTNEEFAYQAQIVLQERLNLLDYAIENYDDGLLFFYFSSTDLQAHMFWWDSDEKHPVRSEVNAKKYFNKLRELYQKMDNVVGDILKHYGDKATVIVMSDHGFANFKRQFNLNSWLRDNGYLVGNRSIMSDVDWSRSRAYGLGINSLYVNLNGRERDGIVEPGDEYENILNELTTKLEAVRDINGRQVIKKVHRADIAYKGSSSKFAPDLIIGYSRNYRASWDTCLGDISKDVLSDNTNVWSADHCVDVSEVPGVMFANRPIMVANPELIDIAPSVLTEFGLKIPETMEGRNAFA